MSRSVVPSSLRLATTLALLATNAPACLVDVSVDDTRTPGEPITTLEAAMRFDYPRALADSYLFYEAQRSGPAQSPRIPWRGPATLGDGADVGLALAGGWYDAGDHVKFGLPMAYAATVLAWSVDEDRATYQRTGQLAIANDNLRFVADYFLAAYDRGPSAAPDDDRFAFQVGDGNADHGYWGPPEQLPGSMARPTFLATKDRRATEAVAGTAAALAAISIAIRPDDAARADRMVAAARDLYRFAEAFPGNDYYNQVADPFYKSWSGYQDELVWGAVWLHRATADASYLDKARAAFAGVRDRGAAWAFTWDNVIVGAMILLDRADPAGPYRAAIDDHFRFWLPGGGVRHTAGGLAWLAQWGSLRYATTEAFAALAYARSVTDAGWATRLREFGVRQINYALGDNPRNASYVVGFGTSSPRNPHHRAAHGSTTNDINVPAINTHVLTGALVGGPETADDLGWRDDRGNYLTAEVACDYNAGYTAAMASLLTLAGPGYDPPVTGQPPAPPPPSPMPPPPPPPANGTVEVALVVSSDWGSGYCAEVNVRNATGADATWSVTVPVEGTVREVWNARWSQDGARVIARGVDWNARLAPGAAASWGFCSDRATP